MDLITAKVEAAAKSKDGKKIFILVDAEGECSLSNTYSKEAIAAYKNGNEVALEAGDASTSEGAGQTAPPPAGKKVKSVTTKKPKTMATPAVSKKVAKKAPAKKVVAKKAATPNPDRIVRGNNMFLSKGEWAKVDAILKKEDKSFSEWSRGLVLAKIK